jgi:hypothetical protein
MPETFTVTESIRGIANPLGAWLQHLIAGQLNPTDQRPYQHLLPLPSLVTTVAADMQQGNGDCPRMSLANPSRQRRVPSRRVPVRISELGDAEGEVHGTPLD